MAMPYGRILNIQSWCRWKSWEIFKIHLSLDTSNPSVASVGHYHPHHPSHHHCINSSPAINSQNPHLSHPCSVSFNMIPGSCNSVSNYNSSAVSAAVAAAAAAAVESHLSSGQHLGKPCGFVTTDVFGNYPIQHSSSLHRLPFDTSMDPFKQAYFPGILSICCQPWQQDVFDFHPSISQSIPK